MSHSLDWLPVEKSLKWAMLGESLNTDSISSNLSSFLESEEVSHNVISESVLSGDENHLTSGDLELCSSEGFLGVVYVFWVGSNGDKNGADADTGALAKSLSVGVTHTGLESISTGA